MKAGYWAISVLVMVLAGYGFYEATQPRILPGTRAVNSLLAHSAYEFQTNHGWRLIGTTVSMPEGDLRLLGLEFTKVRWAKREELRQNLVTVSQRFLEIINADQDIRPYMAIYPFSIENIEIILFVDDVKGSIPLHPDIAVAGLWGGKMFYKTQVREDGVLKTVERFTETYEEALEILKKQSEGKGFE